MKVLSQATIGFLIGGVVVVSFLLLIDGCQVEVASWKPCITYERITSQGTTTETDCLK